MNAFEAIVLGVVQGLTEFLPISSTAHLRIVPAFAGWEDPGAAFTAVVQLGTMAAVLLYFRHELWRIASALLVGLRRPEVRRTLDFRLGVRVWDVVDEEQVEDGRPVRVWGWSYRTLRGHLERGQMTYEVRKWLDTGAVEFRIAAVSHRARVGNPLVRVGFVERREHPTDRRVYRIGILAVQQ